MDTSELPNIEKMCLNFDSKLNELHMSSLDIFNMGLQNLIKKATVLVGPQPVGSLLALAGGVSPLV